VLRALGGLRLGQAVYSFATIGSTNDEAKRLADGGAPEGTLVLAETQTRGRGRLGRRWLTAPGTALALSLVLRPALPARHATRATLLAGVAVCEALEQAAALRPALKWPNDVLLDGRKAGGILVETGLAGARLDYLVVGIGLNVSQAPPPEAVLFPATCVEAAAGRPVDRLGLLGGIVERLEARYAGLDAGYAGLHADWLRRLAWVGERVVAHSPEGDYHGCLAGADDEGALLVRMDDGQIKRIVVGEVAVRVIGN
jgi:BirA family biotin operon repressor/biotin-[acetyl-CoA-carboxylase] ligase